MRLYRGRMNRATYLCCLATMVALVMAMRLPSALGSGVGVMFGMSVFRLHDIGRSGKWAVPPMLAAFAAIVLPLTVAGAGLVWAATAGVLMFTIPVVLLGLTIWLGSVPGQADENRYGAPPRPGVTLFKAKPALGG